MPKVGRPPAIDGIDADAICGYIEDGLPMYMVLEACGVNRSTFYRWRERAEGDGDGETDRKCRALWDRIKRAQLESVISERFKMLEAGKGEWQKHAWWLERVYPRDFGRQVLELQHTGKDGEELQQSPFAGLSYQEASELLRQLQDGRGDD